MKNVFIRLFLKVLSRILKSIYWLETSFQKFKWAKSFMMLIITKHIFIVIIIIPVVNVGEVVVVGI